MGWNKQISGKRGRNKGFLFLSTKKRGRNKEMVEGRKKEFWPKYSPLLFYFIETLQFKKINVLSIWIANFDVFRRLVFYNTWSQLYNIYNIYASWHHVLTVVLNVVNNHPFKFVRNLKPLLQRPGNGLTAY